MLVAPGGVNVVVLEEHGGRQDDIGIARGVGHELLVDAHEKVFSRKAAAHFRLMRSDGERIGVLDQHRPNWRSPFERLGVAGQYRAYARLVKTANAQVADVQTLDHCLLQLVDAAVAVEGAASLVRPCAGDGGNAERRVDVRRAVALAREAVAKAEEASLRPPDQRGEFLDLSDADAGDWARPFGAALLHMRLELMGRVGVP